MKIQSRILSTFLAVVLMLGSVAFVGTLAVSAAGELSDVEISRIRSEEHTSELQSH